MSDAEMKLFEVKTQQIKEILESEDITYGMAKMIIQKVEAELLESGDIFLNGSKFKNISPIVSNTVELGPGKSIVLNT